MSDRVIRDGQVAVLYSPGFGAGWSSWNDDDLRVGFLFHPALVAAVENNNRASLTQEFVRDALGLDSDRHVCVLGAGSLRIEWVPQGDRVRINEYDGSESVVADSIDTSWVNV